MYEHDALTRRIIGCAIAVHRLLGPGLLERTYERAFAIELNEAGLAFEQQNFNTPVLRQGGRRRAL